MRVPLSSARDSDGDGSRNFGQHHTKLYTYKNGQTLNKKNGLWKNVCASHDEYAWFFIVIWLCGLDLHARIFTESQTAPLPQSGRERYLDKMNITHFGPRKHKPVFFFFYVIRRGHTPLMD